ncbi:twin-arginine translocation signal domain-containing protein [Yoonia sediminilitoris]|uniref:Secreted protein n=1 Tax=Yoonia sediminilitoris TaxID=1286148 RepID=A0A2T6KR02_9RHOB|nr:twin-arginine translocation signal domain-containing protein [Yoonia sediminilitoris]PUB18965.1 secreted protein [Yoonia sediminilitoris]RCW99133.1 secreted protein [Yoonia sediminilitoris]
MQDTTGPKGLTRRELLSRSTAAGATFVVGAGFLAAPNAAWAVETTTLKPETFATLVQMARDIYPHDKVGDEFYVVAVKGYDADTTADMVEAGVAGLNAAARGKGHASYLAMGWERDRVDILRGMEDSAFFQQIRGGLVTGLYNQKAVWPIFGYEGASFDQGGYIDRGFNDINWL